MTSDRVAEPFFSRFLTSARSRRAAAAFSRAAARCSGVRVGRGTGHLCGRVGTVGGGQVLLAVGPGPAGGASRRSLNVPMPSPRVQRLRPARPRTDGRAGPAGDGPTAGGSRTRRARGELAREPRGPLAQGGGAGTCAQRPRGWRWARAAAARPPRCRATSAAVAPWAPSPGRSRCPRTAARSTPVEASCSPTSPRPRARRGRGPRAPRGARCRRRPGGRPRRPRWRPEPSTGRACWTEAPSGLEVRHSANTPRPCAAAASTIGARLP